MKKSEVSTVTITLVILIIIAAVMAVVYSSIKGEFISVAYDMHLILLALAVYFLHLLGGGLILFGSVLVLARYIRVKLRAPFQPFGAAPRVVFLTLGLEIFIGAEIINLSMIRTWDKFLVLIFAIVARGIIGLILHLERKWGEQEST